MDTVIKYCLSFALLLMLFSCANLGKKFNLNNEYDTTKALVYIYRPHVSYDSLNPEVPFLYLGKEKINNLHDGGYIALLLEAGEYKFLIKDNILGVPAGDLVSLKFRVVAGEQKFIRFAPELKKLLVFSANVQVHGDYKFEVVNKKEALNELSDIREIK